jgi:hypothetical protein
MARDIGRGCIHDTCCDRSTTSEAYLPSELSVKNETITTVDFSDSAFDCHGSLYYFSSLVSPLVALCVLCRCVFCSPFFLHFVSFFLCCRRSCFPSFPPTFSFLISCTAHTTCMLILLFSFLATDIANKCSNTFVLRNKLEFDTTTSQWGGYTENLFIHSPPLP